ncbi:conjugal transfer protein TrbL [Leucobacter triazinivorans]|uniref:Conjugal transfer protein TrbL n=1 Tax=Leucobacter triazinivorans TaxID=1784719 RepID=A0A4V0Z1A2_9MICO|nr:conjugal transfer protein TrbL [Leucobacter triazinivorans]QBE47699.1 conjugal transfer protein TrbL [Leucobacter triazinivorans]
MSVCDIPVISAVCETAGEAAATLVSAPFDWLASTMGQAAGWLLETMWQVFDSTTLVDVTSDGYLGVYNLLFGIGVFVVLLFFTFQLVLGLIRREPAALSRAALGAAKAVLGSFVVITLTATALEVVDQLCIGIVQAAGETTGTMGDKIMLLTAGLSTINVAAPGVGAIVTIFLAGLMICAVAIVWFSLLIRKALLLVAIVLAPIAFAGAAWDVTRGWVGKWAAFVIALIVSKLVLVVVFLIAITQISTPIAVDLAAVTEPVSGIVLLFIAAFAPYMVYRFISFLGFDLYHAMGSEQEAKSAINRPVPVPAKAQGDGVKKILDGGGNGGSAAGATGAKSAASGAGGGAAASTAGGSGGAAAGGAGAGAAAAGPAAAVVIGAEVAKAAATAGPKLGGAVGSTAETAAGSAGQTAEPTATSQAARPASPQPRAPSADPAPPRPAPPAPRLPKE